MEKKNVHVGSVDLTLYLVVILLVGIGVVMVFSASYMTAANRAIFDFDPFFFLRRNAIFAIMGFVAMNVLAYISYEFLRPFSLILYIICAVLLVVVMFIGVQSGGAVRWIPFPIIGRFQPSELAKAAIIFTLAFLIERYPKALHSWVGLISYSALVGVMAALVFYGGFSASVIIAAIGFGMIFIASPHFWRFILAGGGLVGAVVGYLVLDQMFFGGFRGRRFTAWLDPFSDQMGVGFQTVQSLFAVASGGWFGVGIGQSRQASFIPEPHNDIIFAIIVEELGLVGAGMILILFGVFIWRGIIIAIRAKDTFSSLVAIGIVFTVAFQTIINVAVVTNTIPNTGVTLPFISYGGTSLLVKMGLAGILLNISRYVKEEQPEPRRTKPRKSERERSNNRDGTNGRRKKRRRQLSREN